MNLAVIAPAFYPSLASIPLFTQSAARHGIPVNLYGLTRRYTHWIDTHINECFHQLRDLTASHILFTDAADVIWLADLNEIVGKYDALHRPPILIGFEESGPNFGGWMGERHAAIDMLQILSKMEGGDPQERLRKALRHEWLQVQPDYTREIFQVVDGSDLVVIEGRVRNNNTGTWPCLVHFAGGYSSPDQGKRAQMEPMARKLGYE